jgi:hypothetical protein
MHLWFSVHTELVLDLLQGDTRKYMTKEALTTKVTKWTKTFINRNGLIGHYVFRDEGFVV